MGRNHDRVGPGRDVRRANRGPLFGGAPQPRGLDRAGRGGVVPVGDRARVHRSAVAGRFRGAVLVYVYYKDHFDATDDPATKLGVFCTMPAIMDKPRNLFCEFLGTFLLVFVILAIGNEQNTPKSGWEASEACP